MRLTSCGFEAQQLGHCVLLQDCQTGNIANEREAHLGQLRFLLVPN